MREPTRWRWEAWRKQALDFPHPIIQMLSFTSWLLDSQKNNYELSIYKSLHSIFKWAIQMMLLSYILILLLESRNFYVNIAPYCQQLFKLPMHPMEINFISNRCMESTVIPTSFIFCSFLGHQNDINATHVLSFYMLSSLYVLHALFLHFVDVYHQSCKIACTSTFKP